MLFYYFLPRMCRKVANVITLQTWKKKETGKIGYSKDKIIFDEIWEKEKSKNKIKMIVCHSFRSEIIIKKSIIRVLRLCNSIFYFYFWSIKHISIWVNCIRVGRITIGDRFFFPLITHSRLLIKLKHSYVSFIMINSQLIISTTMTKN